MKKAATHTTAPAASVPPSLGFGSLGGQFLDTTWRVATPVLLFAVGGIVLDRHFGTKPWATLVLTCAGFGVAAWLIKLQLQRLNGGER